MSYATEMWNNLPSKHNGLTPNKIVSRTLQPDFTYIKRAHVWGCLVYVLDPALQDGRKLPKWSPRSRRGQFLGFSPSHLTQIGLIRNLRTG